MRGLAILTGLPVIISMFVLPTACQADEPVNKPNLSASDRSKIQQMLNEDQPTKTPAKKGTTSGGATKKGPGSGTTAAPQSSGTTGKK